MHSRKTIITCAVTANIVTPAQHPALPVTPAQIAPAALEAAEAGRRSSKRPRDGASMSPGDAQRGAAARTAALPEATGGAGGGFDPPGLLKLDPVDESAADYWTTGPTSHDLGVADLFFVSDVDVSAASGAVKLEA